MGNYCCYLKQKLDRTIYCKFFNKPINISECSNCCNRVLKAKKSTKRTNKLAISKDVKVKVWARDSGRCIFCGKLVSWNYANSHFIKRSQGGLGVEQNIMTNCQECHHLFDNTIKRNEMLIYAEKYLRSCYQNWNKNDLVFKKGDL